MERLKLPEELNTEGQRLLNLRKITCLATTPEEKEILEDLVSLKLKQYFQNESNIKNFLASLKPEELLFQFPMFKKQAEEQSDLVEKFISKYLNKEAFKISIEVKENTITIVKMIGSTYNKFSKDLNIENSKKSLMKKQLFLESYLNFITISKFKNIIEAFNLEDKGINYKITPTYISKKNYVNFNIEFSIEAKHLTSDYLEELSYIISDINEELDMKGIF